MLELDGETVLRSPSRSSATSTPGWRRPARSSCTSRGRPTSPGWTTSRRSSTSWSSPSAVEQLLEHRGAPPGHLDPHADVRAQPGVSSHLLWLATNGSDVGAINMLVYGWRDRELVLAFFEKVTGLRMNHNYIRPGGVAADLPDGWRDDVAAICEAIPRRMDEYDASSPASPSSRTASRASGPCRPRGHRPRRHRAAAAVDRRGVGPAPGQPYLAYDEVDFDVIVGTQGDCWDRYAVRLNEIRESIRIVRQILDMMPAGRLPDPGQEGHAAAAQPHRRVHGSPHPPLQAVHRGVPGAAGRGLRAGREHLGARAGLLHRVGRHRTSPTGCTCGPQLRQPAGAGADGCEAA